MAQPLLTPASVASSLTPPRIPPHGSVLHRLYANPRGIRDAAAAVRRRAQREESHDALAARLLRLSEPQLRRLLTSAPHPHLPKTLCVPDRLTRFLGTVLPVEFQHHLRDSGFFRWVVDGLVTASSPLVGVGHWREVRDFLELTRATDRVPRGLPGPDGGAPSPSEAQEEASGGRGRGWTRRRIPYGDHPMQHCDLFLPPGPAGARGRTPVRGTLFFVHGGAWGSGRPWMYRLVAPPFLRRNFAVVISGYRTFPDAPTLAEQRGDVRAGWERCGAALRALVVPADDDAGGDGWVGNVLMGHSSGAHVALLVLVEMLEERMSSGINAPPTLFDGDTFPWAPDHFVGLSGVYDISHHYEYEARRGVEQISPMQPICGRTRENFRRASPAQRLAALLGTRPEGTLPRLVPRTLLVHGVEDTTVPFAATADAGRVLRGCGLTRCEEVYLAGTSHQEVVMHLMLGGPAREAVLEWLLQGGHTRDAARLRSRL